MADTLIEWDGKYPEERRAYTYDWTDVLAGEARTGFEASSDDLTVVVEEPEWAGSIMTLWVSGGTGPSSGHRIEMVLETDADRVLKVDALLPIKWDGSAEPPPQPDEILPAAYRYFAGGPVAGLALGEAGSEVGQFFSYHDGAGGLIYRERTVDGSIEIAQAATKSQVDAKVALTALAAGNGLELAGFQSDLPGAILRNQRTRILEAELNALDFLFPVDDPEDPTYDAINAVKFAQLTANVPTGKQVIFPNKGIIRTNDTVVWTKQFPVLDGGGTAIWKVTAGPAMRFALTEASNGNGDIRGPLVQNLDVYSAISGNAIEVLSPVGLHQFTLDGVLGYAGDPTTGYGLYGTSSAFTETIVLGAAWVTATEYLAGEYAVSGGTTYLALEDHISGATFAADLAAGKWALLSENFGLTFRNRYTFFNGYWLDKLSDGFCSNGTRLIGQRKSLIDLQPGAFMGGLHHDFAQARDGYVKVACASQLKLIDFHIEQPITVDPSHPDYPNAAQDINATGNSLEIDASNVDMGKIEVQGNFGGSTRVDEHLVLTGTKAISGFRLKPSAFSISATGVDVNAGANVLDPIIEPGQYPREDRLLTGFNPTAAGYVAAEAAYQEPAPDLGFGGDSDDLLVFVDASVGMMGRWRDISEIDIGQGTTDAGGFRFKKDEHGRVWPAGAMGLTTFSDDYVLFLMPPGLRPRQPSYWTPHDAAGNPCVIEINPGGYATIKSGGAAVLYFSGAGFFQARRVSYRPGA